MFTSLKRVFKFAWQGFWHNKGLSFQVVFIIGVAVFVSSALFFFKAIGSQAIALIQDRVDIAVYFKKEISEEEILKARQDISQLSYQISEVDYVSRQEAFDKFQADHQNDDLWLAALEEIEGNPFLASLNIKVVRPDSYAQVAQFLEESSFNDLIDRVSYSSADKNKRALNRLFAIISQAKTLSFALAFLLGLLVMVITFNTVKLSILTAKEEIAAMRLVGAANWFIKSPFLIQGLIYSFFAVLIVDVLFLIGLIFFNHQLAQWFLGLDFLAYFKQNILTITTVQLLAAFFLSFFSTLLAVRKHLMV